MSSYATGRSGNRGECSQMCRHKYSLTDAEHNLIANDKFFLSLKDLNLSANIEDLIEAGIDSFKIEGRLKGPEYVKNITAYYRQKIDSVLSKRNDTERSSVGKSSLTFIPNPDKSFNRSFTDYFVYADKHKIASIDTPKSIGEFIGVVDECNKEWLTINSSQSIVNGDGLCFYDKNVELSGFRVNKADGEKIFPNPKVNIAPGTQIYRNRDINFDHLLSNSKSCRKIWVDIELSETNQGIGLKLTDEQSVEIEVIKSIDKQIAKDPEKQKLLIKQQLSKIGDSIFMPRNIDLKFSEPLFIPSRTINELRREACLQLQQKRFNAYERKEIKRMSNQFPYYKKQLGYDENISNILAEKFYRKHGVESIEKAFELTSKKSGQILMTSKYCIRKELDICLLELPIIQRKKNTSLYLEDNTGIYKIEFDCSECKMNIYSV
jgi:23S rRNA 5-hydroxycytidine C2501 synthase